MRRIFSLFSILGVAVVVAAACAASAVSDDGARQVATAPASFDLKAAYARPRDIPFPEDNRYSREKARLGKMLYFDPRLSRSNMQSCASCHNPSFAWGDGLPLGVGHGMKTLGRRTPTILNLAWAEIFMWDGRFGSLEEQALGPIEAPGEMNMPIRDVMRRLAEIEGYRELFESVFPDEGITPETIGKAIATYERTVVSGHAPFDRWIAGNEDAISDQAKRGFELFNGKARCASCHSGWNFTDDSFHDIGLQSRDPGRGAIFPDIPKMQHAFKTPGLRNIAQRAPFMHDGSIADLAGVVRHYDHEFVRRPSLSDDIVLLGLTDSEIDDIVAFLETLTSEDQVVTFPVLPR